MTEILDHGLAMRREVPWGLIEFEQDEHHRAYWITENGKGRTRAVSVTTFLQVLDKPALNRWKEDAGIRNAIAAERAGVLSNVALEDVADTCRTNKIGSEHTLAAAAMRGTEIHALLERYATTGEVPSPASFAPEQRGYVRSLLRWLLSADTRGFEVEATEQLVAHPQFKYAGRYDLRARLGGFSHIIDLKTNRHGRVWPDHHYQPVAYALAASLCGEEEPHQCLIVALGPEGYEEMRACVGPADVKRVLETYRAVGRLEHNIIAERKRLEAAA